MDHHLINIFGHGVRTKIYDCDKNGALGLPLKPEISLYVRLTNRCNAGCKFCTFHGRNLKFDVPKFIKTITEISEKVTIRRISFTGGEPTFERDLLDLCLFSIRQLDLNIFTIVNSNGFNLKDFPIELVDSLALSKHHYSAARDAELFARTMGESFATDQLIKDWPMKERLHLTCTMAKNYIDSPSEMYKYLTHYAKLGVMDFGFVSLMPTNEWAAEHYINSLDVLNNLDHTTKQTTWEKYDRRAVGCPQTCRCANFLTSADGYLVSSYARENLDPRSCESVLVYDINQLTNGFNGPVIL